jgi:hypothetical protein
MWGGGGKGSVGTRLWHTPTLPLPLPRILQIRKMIRETRAASALPSKEAIAAALAATGQVAPPPGPPGPHPPGEMSRGGKGQGRG